MPERSNTSREQAEMLAIQALTFLAADPDRLSRFLAETGIGPDSLRTAAREPRFLTGVLDYLAANEWLLRGFAEENDLDPAIVMRAHGILAGESRFDEP